MCRNNFSARSRPALTSRFRWPPAGEAVPGEGFFHRLFVEAVSRTSLIKAELLNRERQLKPGMFASLDLRPAQREAHSLASWCSRRANVYLRHTKSETSG